VITSHYLSLGEGAWTVGAYTYVYGALRQSLGRDGAGRYEVRRYWTATAYTSGGPGGAGGAGGYGAGYSSPAAKAGSPGSPGGGGGTNSGWGAYGGLAAQAAAGERPAKPATPAAPATAATTPAVLPAMAAARAARPATPSTPMSPGRGPPRAPSTGQSGRSGRAKSEEGNVTLNPSFLFTRLRGRDGIAEVADWTIDWTDDTLPSSVITHLGTTAIDPKLKVPLEGASAARLKDAVVATMGPDAWASQQFHIGEQLKFQHLIYSQTEEHVLEPPDLKAYLADKRWQAEVGGIEVGGVPVATDDRSKMMIMGARLKAEADPSFTTAWKSGDGFATLDAPTLIAVSDAVLAHVDRCFAIEAELGKGIAHGTVKTTAEIDTAFAWTSSSSD